MEKHFRRALTAGGIAALSALALLPTTAFGAAGDLDPSFSGDGRALVNFGAQDFATGGFLTADGKVMLGGTSYQASGNSAAFALLGKDGSPDPSFAGTGSLLTKFGRSTGYTYATAPGPNGSIVALGGVGSPRNFTIDRVAATGAIDPTFTPTTVDFGSDDYPQAAAVQPDGKVVTVGVNSIVSSPNSNVAITRTLANGGPDPSFNAGTGKLTIDLNSTKAEEGRDVVIRPDGRIDVAITSADIPSLAVIQLNANGSIDGTFGTGGLATIGGAAGFDRVSNPRLALQPDGKLVIAGVLGKAADSAASLTQVARMDTTGAADLIFGASGVVDLTATTGQNVPGDIVLQPDGKILYGGSKFPAALQLVTRLTSSGAVDTSFGSGGTTEVDFGGFDILAQLMVAPDGAIVGVGDGGTINDFTAFRLLGDPVAPVPPAPTAECAGKTATIAGTAKRDVLKGTKRRDVIAGLGGNDKILGFAGNDLICGGAGKDSIYGGKGKDTLIGQAGADKLFGGAGRDKLQGGPGRDGQHQ